jgi:hypothetical protein
MASATRPAPPATGSTTSEPADRQASGWLELGIEETERHWPWALGALMLIEALILLYMGRGLSFFYDDWDFVTHDFGGGFHSLMMAHVGNISVFPIAVYKVLFHLVGLNHYTVFRIVVIALHLLSAGLVFVLASRRIPRVPALLATALILFLGAAWEDLLWAFQIGYLLSIAGGLAAWVLLERKDRLGDIVAMLCLTVSAGSSSLGIAMMVGVAVELAWRRSDRRRLWIVLVPAFLYVLWYLNYGENEVTRNSLIAAPGYVEELVAAAFGGLVGRGLEWGRPLALVGLLVLLRRLARPLPVSPRLAGLLATGVALWVITAAARSTISPADSSRYVYLGAVVIVLVGVELLRGVTITPRVTALATALVAFCAITGLTVMHSGALGRREVVKAVNAELGALEIAAAYAPPTYEPDPQRAPQLMAGPYLHTVRAIGSSPADTPAEITAADGTTRAAADGVLLALEAPKLTTGKLSSSDLAPTGTEAPAVDRVTTGRLTPDGACLRFAPAGSGAALDLRLSAGVTSTLNAVAGPPVAVRLRRFADGFPVDPLGVIAGGGSAILRLPRDAASAQPWHVRISSAQRVTICHA